MVIFIHTTFGVGENVWCQGDRDKPNPVVRSGKAIDKLQLTTILMVQFKKMFLLSQHRSTRSG